MSQSSSTASRVKIVAAAVIMAASFVSPINAQTAGAPPSPSPARHAVDVRKAIYTLIGSNFKPIGDVLQGRAQYDAAEVQKRAARVAFLAELAGEAFPDVSNVGLPATRTKANAWNDRAQFDQRLKEFQEHARALVQVASKENSATDIFKAAASAVAQDCKGCHDNFREK